MPPEAGGGEMPPEAGGGGVPPEAGGMDEEAAIQELVMALVELGVSPEQYAAMAGGGVDEQSGEIAPTEEAGPKLAKMAQVHQRSGKFKITTANDGTPQRKVRDYFKGYLNELLRKQ
jgi:hypothetical protein